MLIRHEQPADVTAIRQVIESAFGRAAEAELVERLRERGKSLLSLVAESDGVIVGHVLFSEGTLENNPSVVKVAGLAPLAVASSCQKQGVGSLLTRAGLDWCKAAGFGAVIVLGHPKYYPRFGFVPASRFGIKSEYDVRDEVFMAMELTEHALTDCSGIVRYQPEFNEL